MEYFVFLGNKKLEKLPMWPCPYLDELVLFVVFLNGLAILETVLSFFPNQPYLSVTDTKKAFFESHKKYTGRRVFV